MKKLAIDTNVVDFLLDHPDVLAGVLTLAGRAEIRFIVQHIIADQLRRVPDAARRTQLLGVYDSLPKEIVATRGFVLGTSVLGGARLGDGGESGITLDQARTRGRGAVEDALIATTASGDADVLITADAGLRKKVIAAGTARCEAWSLDDFSSFVRDQSR